MPRVPEHRHQRALSSPLQIKRRDSLHLNRLIDRALLDESRRHTRDVLLASRDPAALAERIRRRSTVLAHAEPARAERILNARDILILAVYGYAAPPGWHRGWCDGSSAQGPAGRYAGIGGVVMDPDGDIIAEISHTAGDLDAMRAEAAALAATLKVAREHGAKRIRMYTDCKGLVLLWARHRNDPRLAAVQAQVGGLLGLDLRVIPRQHNQRANALARKALN